MTTDLNNNQNQTVLVTGGSGYVAGWTIIELLKKGYQVRTTVRNLDREKTVRATIATQIEPGNNLTFFAADLLNDAGWQEAVQGVDYVLHVASPMGVGDPKADLITPAREGTLRVLRASTRAGVKRVVLTSSGVAAQPALGQVADETVWTDLNSPKLDNYTEAKTRAERAAWDFMAQQGGPTSLVTVLPGAVEGPLLGTDAPTGWVELIARMLRGKMPAIPHIGFYMVDVRDVVDLQLRAMTAPQAAGQRFLATTEFLWLSEVARLLRENLGAKAAKVPTRQAPDFMLRIMALFNDQAKQIAPRLGKRANYSSAKATRLLDWQPRPISQTIIECGESLIKAGLV